MKGNNQSPGFIPQALASIFKRVEEVIRKIMLY